MNLLYGAPAEVVKSCIEEAAKPLGLMTRPYAKGTAHVQEIAVLMMRHDAISSRVLQNPNYATGKRKRLNGEPIDIEGDYGDQLLFVLGFFPNYLMRTRKGGLSFWNGLGVDSYDANHDPRNMQLFLEDLIKTLYRRSPNPFLKEERRIVSARITDYVRCMADTRVKLWEDNPNVEEGMNRLLVARTQGLHAMDISEQIRVITQTAADAWNDMLRYGQCDKEN
jgi:hypothetical protein